MFSFNEIWYLIVFTFILMWPAYLANMFPVIWAKIPGLKKLSEIPLDGGRSLGKNRILGDHKTLGGVVAAVVGGAIGGLMSFSYVASFWQPLEIYSKNILLFAFFGAVLGFGAILGDSLKSFFKRRVGIASGKAWPFFDQVDFVIGAWIASWFITGLEDAFSSSGTWMYFVVALIITPLLHLFSNVVAYKLGLKKVWW